MSHTIITILWILAAWLTISFLVVFISLGRINSTGPTLLGYWISQIWKGLLSFIAALIWVPGGIIIVILMNSVELIDKIKEKISYKYYWFKKWNKIKK
jgi:hypothetical protein